MSKNFNQEYKELMEQEVPDLWNRIEPALHDKKSTLVETKIDIPRSIIKFPVVRIMKYTGVLAACVCLVILIPTFINGTKGSSQSQDNSQAEMTNDYKSESTEQSTEAIIEESTEGVIEESTEEVMEQADPDSIDTAVENEEAGASDGKSDEMVDSEVMEEAPLMEDNTIFQGIEVYIISIKELSEGAYSYQVEIANVDHDIFQEGLEIVINTHEQEMKKGRTYTVTIVGPSPNVEEVNEYILQEIQ